MEEELLPSEKLGIFYIEAIGDNGWYLQLGRGYTYHITGEHDGKPVDLYDHLKHCMKLKKAWEIKEQNGEENLWRKFNEQMWVCMDKIEKQGL